MKTKILLFFTVLTTSLIYFSCSKEDSNLTDSEKESTVVQRVNSNNHEYNILYQDRDLQVILEKDNSLYTNNFIYKDSSENTIFSLSYSFDNSVDDWKYYEESKALLFATELKSLNLGIAELQKLNFMLDGAYGDLIYEVNEQSLDMNLFSIIGYLKSAVASNIRALDTNSPVITGTLSPTFLVDKTFFTFQEDLKVDLTPLKSNIGLLEDEASIYNNQSDLNLIEFIRTTNKDIVSYDEIYSFYVNKSTFKQHVSDRTTFNKKDCSKWCVIGCGTDWGCCSNYSGCCYFSSMTCLMHDLACIECTPAWFCFSGCVPDHGVNDFVNVIISPL